METKFCPVCSSRLREKLVTINMEKFLGDKFKPITIEKSICNVCGHIYANRYYDATKHYEVTRASDNELIYYKEDYDKIFTKLVNWLFKYTKCEKFNSILDIGCGKCDLLRVLKKIYRADVYGVDISPQSKIFGDEYGVEVRVGKFDVEFYEQTFDLITITGVLEHQFNINEFLKNVVKLCNDGTKVLIEVPDSTKILERKDAKFMHDIYNDEHVHHFELNTLTRLMGLYGFKLLNSQSINRDDWDSLSAVFEYNNIPNKFRNKSIEYITNLHETLINAKSIALYGAGWHTQVVIPSFYNVEIFDAIYDKDLRKVGLTLLNKQIQYPYLEALNQHDCILISTMSKDVEIEQELIDLGINKSKIVRMY